MAQRAFPNPYADYDKSLATGYFDSSGRLTPEFTQRLNNKIRELLQQMERGLKSADPRDCTGYTGWAGIAVLYLHLYDVYGDPSYLQIAEAYAKKSLNCLTKRSITFLCGDAGPLAVAAVVYHKLRDERQSEACITRLLQLHKLDPRAPDEMLYGRMGYLYALLFVNKHFGEEKIPQNYIQQVCDEVMASGESLAKRRNFTAKSPLMYEWYQEYYIGAAHGLAGIYYYLMQGLRAASLKENSVYIVFGQCGAIRGGHGGSTPAFNEPGLGVSQVKLHNTVKPSVDYVCQLKFPSGNYPPCIDDARDLLVHWCHGAPGVIYMLAQAYKVFADQQYLSDALQCAEVIWQWGLLKKGYGLCHGTAGNAYAFLMLYNLTQNMKYLYRACKFAEWCLSYGEHGCRTPDTPFSLFEGMAGTIYFLADLLVPTKAKFPAFEL
ncbi:glutathione S-transferase LANCL1 isoform X1 [Mauremys reevesii]|uniref:glutathione S-transferase LANCL1 isoform X1 n=1 Tax=Mauremys reevesii TaxID=260615 RepID=UPI00193ED622|nr:glutathione S-transferase LANCL1 isoform X1 [Mauremys reevesii]XP_039351117.1 glutathione S-transferase LANCL1 isoform X1 [Mauremys reevesii]XP_039351118.1 glutathione S-transferase LANCL1 isoform X1 [Mauremys reevesii]